MFALCLLSICGRERVTCLPTLKVPLIVVAPLLRDLVPRQRTSLDSVLPRVGVALQVGVLRRDSI